MRFVFPFVAVAFAACLAGGPHPADSVEPPGTSSCGALLGLRLDRAAVVVATMESTGTFELKSPGYFDPPFLQNLPVFCRVEGVATPVAGSRIGFEIWLPAGEWNGRLLMLGNGGYSSSLPYVQMAARMQQGYAVLATDTGHRGDDPVFARGRPEAIEDWGHRAVHESLRHARTVITRFYGETPRFAYFAGCSTGGHQALMSAQRYPADFDGIVAGAPGHNRTHLNAGFLWQFLSNHGPTTGAETVLPASKLQVVNDAVLNACRKNNGSLSGGLPSDPYLDDPLACDFDPASMLCPGDEAADCLTQRQVDVLVALYDGPRNPRTGDRIYFGQTPGSEAAGGPPGMPGWSLYWADPRQPGRPARASFWQYWAFRNPQWDWWTFDFDDDMRVTDERLAEDVNAMNPDLERFRQGGGKLIQFHGLNDPVVPATDSISFYARVRASLGSEIDDFYRLFLAPGVEHCQGGPGPDTFDLLGPLVGWVESGEAPDRIVATRFEGGARSGKVGYRRPLCPYPEYAEYRGTGNSDRAESFVCSAETERPLVPPIGPAYLR